MPTQQQRSFEAITGELVAIAERATTGADGSTMLTRDDEKSLTRITLELAGC